MSLCRHGYTAFWDCPLCECPGCGFVQDACRCHAPDQRDSTDPEDAPLRNLPHDDCDSVVVGGDAGNDGDFIDAEYTGL